MVFFWQVFLGIILIVTRVIGGKYYTGVAYVLIIFWSVSQTSGELTAFQIFVQGIIAGLLLLIPDQYVGEFLAKSSNQESSKFSTVMGCLLIIGFIIVVFGILLVIVKVSR